MPSVTSVRAEIARKALHAATAALPLGWALGWLSTPTLRVLLSAATVVALLVEVARRQSRATAARFEAAFGALLRPHEHQHLTGATWLALAMTAAVWLVPEPAAIAALWAAAVGDSSAAVVGRTVSHWRGSPRQGKTILGSLALALTSAGGIWWLAKFSWPVALGLGAVAALAERPAWRLDDNLRIIAAVALTATLVGLR